LEAIAQRYHTTVGAIASANRLGTLSILPAGYALTIDDCSAAGAPETATDDPNIEVIQNAPTRIEALKVSPPAPPELATDVGSRVDQATIRVVVASGDHLVIGTGTVVGKDGLTLLTAFHVIGDPLTGERDTGQEIHVGPYRNFALQAQVVASDWQNDLAVLHIEPQKDFGGFGFLPLADSDTIDLGEPVYLFGYPARQEGGLQRTAGRLVVTSTTEKGTRDALFTEAMATHGSSGGVAVSALTDRR